MPRRAPVRSLWPSGVGRSALLWLAGAGLVLLFVWQQAEVDRLALGLEREEDRRTRLTSDVNALRFEVESLAGHVQVAGEAEERLDMVRPEPFRIYGLRFQDPARSGRPDALPGDAR